MTNARIVFSAVDSMSAAESIAQALVEERLASCVNIVPGLRSVYRWKATIHNEAEFLLIIKTSSEKSEVVVDRIVEVHPYELPEAVVIDIDGGHPPYLDWISVETESLPSGT